MAGIPVYELDEEILSMEKDSCTAQTVLEALAMLVAVRAWAKKRSAANAAAHVRSDSAAALGAFGKLSSPAPGVNTVIREMSLDVARSSYGLEVLSWGHVAGVLITWADALRRLWAPDAASVPEALLDIEPTVLPERERDWWRTLAPPAPGVGRTQRRAVRKQRRES